MQQLNINEKPVKILLTQVDDSCLRLTLVPAEEQDPFAYLNGRYLSTYAKSRKPSATVAPDEGDKTILVGNFKLQVSASTFEIMIRDAAGKRIQNLKIDQSNGDVLFHVGDKEIYGLGQGFATPMDRRGQVYNMRTHGQDRKSLPEHSTVSAVPYIVSREGWGMFFHHPVKGVIDLTGKIGRFTAQPLAYRDIFIMQYEKPEMAATLYYKLTGNALIPPKYAFGYQQSYRELYHNGESIVMPTAKYMRDNDIPCDTLIYLGRYVENGWNTYTCNGMFEFNPKAFPDPPGMVKELQDMNYKVSLHITETPSGLHGNIEDADVSPVEHDHVKNLWDKHVVLHDYVNNDAWWPDDGDELDLAAFTARHKMYYDGTEQLTPNKRGFYMFRNSYCGDTQYCGVIWSGDVLCKWETLKNHVYVGLNVALSLNPYWGSDIGGFFCTEEYSGELYVRWLEYSVFNPMFRSHGRHSFLHTPWGWKIDSVKDIPNETNPAWGSNMCDAVLPDYRVEGIVKSYIELRYRLVPYIYSTARYAYDTGVPFMRPLWFTYPDDEIASTCVSQYMFGDALLVSPVTKKGAIEWSTYLPAGKWFDFFTHELLDGGQHVTKAVELKDIPVYVPAGTILPMGEVKQYIGDKPIHPLDDKVTIHVYEGKDTAYTLYEDDGITKDYMNGSATYTVFRWDDAEKKLTVTGKSSQIAGESRTFEVLQVGSGKASEVQCVYEGV